MADYRGGSKEAGRWEGVSWAFYIMSDIYSEKELIQGLMRVCQKDT